MPKITLENGIEVEISQESYNNLVKAVQPKTYDDIAKRLFLHKQTYFLHNDGLVKSTDKLQTLWDLPNNCTTRKQAEKLLAMNKMMNVAKYFNGDWNPVFNKNKINWTVQWYEDRLVIAGYKYTNASYVYFKSKETTEQAIEILGEETIKLALSTDW